MRNAILLFLLASCGGSSHQSRDGGECSQSKSRCNVDFPCTSHSVCAGNGVQVCESTSYNGASPECSAICIGTTCCECCYGGTCKVGATTPCSTGTVCRERGGLNLEAGCQPTDGGADLAGWRAPPDGGSRCSF